MNLLFGFIKITGLPLNWIFFKRKVYFENRTKQKRRVKGGCLLVANHKSYWDYISIFFLFFFYKVRPVVSSLIYNKNRVLRFFLRMVGAIVVSDNPLDTGYINKAVELLKKGKKVIIFPEAHFNKSDELMTFHRSYVKIAMLAGVPILPMYTDGRYGLFKKNRWMIGQLHYIPENSELPEGEYLKQKSEEIKKNIQEMRDKVKILKRNHLLDFKYLMWDLGRFFTYITVGLFLRVKPHNYCSEYKHSKLDGPFIIVANHSSFRDPLVVACVMWRRRCNFLASEAVMKGLQGVGLKGLGAIRVDRNKFDMGAVSKCVKSLNNAHILSVFPEGHINREGKEEDFKGGAALIAAKTHARIIACYIPKAKHKLSRSHIAFGDIIEPPEMNRASIDACSVEIKNKIDALKELVKDEKWA